MAGHDYWHTPPELYRVLDAEFGFVLDAAAHANNALAPRWIDEQENALEVDWDGSVVWCNPPYSKMGAFVFKAWEQCQQQRNVIVLLIPAYTDPGYWWDCIVPHADEIRFLRGRVSFLENGETRQSARFPSVVVVFRYRRGVQRGSPRVFWWDWKAETDPEKIAPLFATLKAGQSDPAVAGTL